MCAVLDPTGERPRSNQQNPKDVWRKEVQIPNTYKRIYFGCYRHMKRLLCPVMHDDMCESTLQCSPHGNSAGRIQGKSRVDYLVHALRHVLHSPPNHHVTRASERVRKSAADITPLCECSREGAQLRCVPNRCRTIMHPDIVRSDIW